MSVVYEMGLFRLDPEAKVMTRAGMPAPLGARACAVLATLVERPNEYVSKTHIMDTAWPGLVVEEGNLTVQISAIRRALGEVAGGERWIETLARRGYRFVGPVTRLQDLRPHGSASARTNLPEPLTSFIGRERELVEIKRVLAGSRLVTLTGVGGIGKTRLAQQVAAEVVDAYRDGVWFVDLAPLAEPALVASATAQVLSIGDATGKLLHESLSDRLRDRELLLVLDNCEHMLEACARLAGAILPRAAQVTIVATSREPLQVDGEQIYPLSTLLLPDPHATADAIADSEAAQLFLDRARRQQPHFVLTPTQAPALASLCIHLDGIPLALELAAARVPSLTIEQINARVNDRFRLLIGGSRTAQPRQQTLRGALDWSHGLLSEAARVAWRRLAAFPGGFTLDAAGYVSAGGAVDEAMVVDLLAHLVACSLVIADTQGAGVRYRLLETTRAYGLEKLGEAGEIAAVRRRHAQFVRRSFERAPDDWWHLPEPEWHATYTIERDNVRAALDWAAFDGGGDAALGAALAGASGPIWTALSLRSEGAQRLGAATERIEPAMPDMDQARLWLWLGILLQDSEPKKSLAALEQADELYRRAGDAFGTADAQLRLALIFARMGRADDAAQALAEAAPEVERSGLPKMMGIYCATLAQIQLVTDRLVDARTQYERAQSLFRDAKFEFGERGILGNLANVCWALGELEAAASTFLEYVNRLRSSPASRSNSLGFALCNLAGVLTESSEPERALAAAREGFPLLRDEGYAWIFVDHMAMRAALAGRGLDAARIAGYADAIRAQKEAPREPTEARARARLQAWLEERIDPSQLARLFAAGTELSEDDICRLALQD